MYKTLKDEMERRSITGYRLSKMIGLRRSDLYCALKGIKPMYPGYKQRIAEALGRPVDELFPESEAQDE